MECECRATSVCWVKGRQRCKAIPQQKQTKVQHNPGLLRLHWTQGALEQKTTALWAAAFTVLLEPLFLWNIISTTGKQNFCNKIYLRNVELNKSKHTPLLKVVSGTLIYKSTVWISEKKYFTKHFSNVFDDWPNFYSVSIAKKKCLILA